jgi:hypothetical protein
MADVAARGTRAPAEEAPDGSQGVKPLGWRRGELPEGRIEVIILDLGQLLVLDRLEVLF